MRIGVIIAALMGLAVAAYLVFYVGTAAVFSAVASVGWLGFAALCVYGAALFALLGMAWFVLIPVRTKPSPATFIWGRAVRDCAGEILPFSQVGGIVIGARAVMLRRVGGPVAFASTVVDVTVELVAQIAFVLAGFAILLARAPASAASSGLAKGLAIGLFLGALCVALFAIFQRHSFVRVARWTSRLLPTTTIRAAAVQRSFAAIHGNPVRLGISLAIHLTGWMATAGWAWIAIRLIGRTLSFPSVIAIEAILYGIRSVAVFVPAAIGVQEAAYALLGPLFGLPAPAALAISLLKRARDIALAIPVLATWQIAEGGHALKASRDAAQRIVDE